MKKLILIAVFMAGCAGGNKMLLEGGLFGDEYKPKGAPNQLKDGDLVVTIDTIKNGAMGTDFGIDCTVRNTGVGTLSFDPGEVEIQIPQTGLTYFHVSKNANLVSVPPGINVLLKGDLKPGQAMEGMLWFKTAQGKAEAKTLDVMFHGHTLHFPPAAPSAK